MAKQRAARTTRHIGKSLNQGLAHRRGLSLDPSNLAALQKFTAHADPVEAIARYQALLRRTPDLAEAHYDLGCLHHRRRDLANAIACFRKAATLQPDCFEFHFNLAAALFLSDQFADAANSYRRATRIRPNDVEAHYSLGVALQKLGDESSAMQAYVSALRINPDMPQALSNLGALCLDRDDPQTAEGLLRRSLALDPGNVSAHCNLGGALVKLGNKAGAVDSFREALALDPTHALTLCNLGTFLDNTLDDSAGAVQCYQMALAAHPDSQTAQFYMGLQHLAVGDFTAGWQGYEARWCRPEFRSTRPERLQPQWHGEDIRGSRILIYREQGLGDTLQFIRYIPMVAALGVEIILRVQPSLVRLLSSLQSSAIRVVSADSDEGSDAEWQCPLLSLPLVFGTQLATIPSDIPYLGADVADETAWAQRLSADGPRVGLVWAGNPKHTRDRQRSLALEQLAGLTRLPGITFYSLQKGPAAEKLAASPQPIVDPGEQIEDFTDTAAIIANLDLVICVDTAVAHLAGAMGKPVWLLVPHISDWRWLRDRADSPWYPTMRLFRQPQIGQWEPVLRQVEQELEAMASPQHPVAASSFSEGRRSSAASVTHADWNAPRGPGMAKHRASLSTRQLGKMLGQGLAHQRAGRLAEAIACFRRAIVLQPGCFEFHFNLAAALFASGQLAESAESYRQAALLSPEEADAHYSLGVVLQRMGDTVQAAEAYEKALRIRPEFPNALGNLGDLRLAINDLPAAERLLRRSLALDPGNVNAYRNLGKLLAKQGDNWSALESYRTALALDPDHALTLSNFGATYLRLGELHKAEVILRRAVALDPGNVSAHCSLANALAKQGNVAGAAEATRSALAIDPTHPSALCDFGTLLDLLGDARGAVQCFQLALASHPEFNVARFNIGIQYLGFGDLSRGWPQYEARWETSEFCSSNTRPTLTQPQWRGEDIRGSRIVLYSEQGLGDTLQFVRYVPMVAALGATIVLRVQPPLVQLLSMLNESITVASIESDEGADFEWQCSLMSLPLAFHTDLTTIPGDVPYLSADSAEADAWAQRLPAHGLRVGLVWAGNPTHARDRQRSIALRQLAGVACVQGVAFYSLQKGPATQELAETPDAARIVDLSDHLDDFTDTAAVIANLDLVISVDTSVAHLAGAMGKPVWMLVPHVNDWRWLRDRADSPWYPTMRLFRQPQIGQWEPVLRQVEQELEVLSAACRRSSPAGLPKPGAAALEA